MRKLCQKRMRWAFLPLMVLLCACSRSKTDESALLSLTSLAEHAASIPELAYLTTPGSYFHDEAFPGHWLPWTTDGATAISMGPTFLTRGVRCSGRYCDDVSLFASESGHAETNSWWTDYFSEEGNNSRICENNGFVTGIRCSGSYCDNISLRCSQVDNAVRTGCYWTAALSEEGGGKFIAPQSMYVAGIRCSGSNCDNKQFYLCQADSGGPSFDLDAMAAEFAPRLRFDQEFGTGSGDGRKCFPSDAGAYYALRAQGYTPQSLCNQDYSTIANNEVPVYYMAERVGTNAVMIRYWYFYAWQSTCFLSAGSHAADWESMAVLVVDGQLMRVAYFQHGGWYTKERGSFETTGTHPIGYVGKNAHGTYHDDGGSGGCLYFEDFRNPGSNDYRMDAWNNLVRLGRGSSYPDWMNCTGSSCFDGIGHPIEQTGSMPSLGGCGKDGCDKSSLVANMPFLNDPAGSEYSTILAKHSARLLDVIGGGTGNGVAIQQYGYTGGDNQAFGFERMPDGSFRIVARHSGRCLDVSGASTADGAALIQYACGGGANQRYQLVDQGGGFFEIRAQHSDRCVDVSGASMADGASIVQWLCAGVDNQRFRFSQ